MTRPGRKREVLSVRLPVSMRAVVKALAEVDGVTESDLVGSVLREYLMQRIGSDQPPKGGDRTDYYREYHRKRMASDPSYIERKRAAAIAHKRRQAQAA